MSSPALPFKAAEDKALRDSNALLTVMGLPIVRIYTEVPPNAPLPYVVVGAHEITDLSSNCGEAHSIITTVQWWTKDVDGVKGSVVVRLMGDAIVAALNVELAIEGHATVMCEPEGPAVYGTDPDQSSRGRAVFRYETTALA